MEKAEQNTKEPLNKAKERGEETAKVWADIHELMTDLVQTDVGSDSYHIGLEMLDAINNEFKQNRSAFDGPTHAVNRLTDELRATRLHSLDVVLDRSI